MILSDLQYFITLCETHNFTKASEKLFVSQPSISMSIHRLEEEMGQQLLIRGRGQKPLYLTPAGEKMLDYAKIIIHDVERMREEVSNTPSRKLKLGVPPIIGAYFFPEIMKQLSTEEINAFSTVETGSIEMHQLLKDGEVDMAFIGSATEEKPPNLESYFIARDEFVVCVSELHPLAQKKTIAFSELKGSRFISLGKGFLQSDILEKTCHANGMEEEINNFYYTDELQTAKSLISSDIGVGLMIRSSVGTQRNMVTLRLKDPLYFYIYLWVNDLYPLTGYEKQLKKKLVEASSIFT